MYFVLCIISRHNAGYYVKRVVDDAKPECEQREINIDKSGGSAIQVKKHGIKQGWLV